MKHLLLMFFLTLCISFSVAQTYQRGDTTLNFFAINDTLKYFEFYTPGFSHTKVEVGILEKVNDSLFRLKYTNDLEFTPFNVFFCQNFVRIMKLSTEGYMAYSINEKPFPKTSDSTSQIVSQFYTNYPIFYKAISNISIRVYEYPCYESKIKKIYFEKGSKIEEKWEYSFKKNYKRIKDKTWIAAVCGKKFIGWLLLSDVEDSFEQTEQ